MNQINRKRKAMGIDDDSDGNDHAETDEETRTKDIYINWIMYLSSVKFH